MCVFMCVFVCGMHGMWGVQARPTEGGRAAGEVSAAEGGDLRGREGRQTLRSPEACEKRCSYILWREPNTPLYNAGVCESECVRVHF